MLKPVFCLLQLSGSAAVEQQMSSVLREAFDDVRADLKPALQGPELDHSGSAGGPEDETTRSLLEKYSDLLVQMTRNKLDRL